MRMRLKLMPVLAAVCIFIFGCFEKEKMPPVIALEDFFRIPEKTGYTLAPDGEHIAFLSPWKTRLNIYVQQIGEEIATRITSAIEKDITNYLWVSNERIVYVEDPLGNDNYNLCAININGYDFKELTQFEKSKVQIIDGLENNDEEILIEVNNGDAQVSGAYRLNIITGKRKKIAENPGNIIGWATDNEGQLRIALASDGVDNRVMHRTSEESDFQPLIETRYREIFVPLFFTFDNKNLFVASNVGFDKVGIFEYNIENKEHTRLIFRDPTVDVSNLLISSLRKKITSVTYLTDKKRNFFFDEDMKQLQELLEKRLPGYEVSLDSISQDETKVLVTAASDRSLETYYYFDRKRNNLRKLSGSNSWIQEEALAEMKPITYKSRDGLIIYGYLTLPRGLKPQKLPIVVYPHGGPWGRNIWGYNPEVQFLANRGYAVLQMNFRGSTGYGRSFWEAGFRQWGLSMQDDITDGVKWLLEQGIADPKRISIFGSSYGGYATLLGLISTPDLYTCGIDYCGISNLFTFLKSIPTTWDNERQMYYEMIGHPDKDRNLLEKISPVFHIDKINVPLLIAQGVEDQRAKKEESDNIVATLAKKGIDVVYIVKEKEGHGFQNENNRFEFYKAMEEFLGKYLGGRVEEKSNKEFHPQ